jgi:hypothetical protein
LLVEYNHSVSVIVSADEIKKTLRNYSPSQAEAFHRQSAKLADTEFYSQLQIPAYSKVIVLGGGAASGKTEFLVTHLKSQEDNAVFFDTTFSTTEGAKIKIRNILKAKKLPVLYFVFPDDLKRAYIAFLHRDRKFSDKHFYRTHSGSRSTLLWIVENRPQVEIHMIESSYTSQQKLQFAELIFGSQPELKDFIHQLQMSETDIIKAVTQS